MGSVDARVDRCARRQNSIVMPLQQKNGFPFAFTVGAYGGAISHFLEGVSWIGGYAQRMSVYTLSVTIECLIFECCGHCIRPMITKQGIEASKILRQKALDAGQPDPGEIGLGALSAAVSNLSSLIGIVSPIAWGCEPPRYYL